MIKSITSIHNCSVMGVLVATGMVVHEFSEGVITYVVLQKAGVRKRLVHIYAFVIAALTTPIGAFLAFLFVNKLNQPDLGLMIGFAGAILYVGAALLLPEATEQDKKHSLVVFLFILKQQPYQRL